jgi:hypothetical protein
MSKLHRTKSLSRIVREAYFTTKDLDQYIEQIDKECETNGYKIMTEFHGGHEDWLVKELESGEIFTVDVEGCIDRVLMFQNPCDLGETYDWQDMDTYESNYVLISTVDENWEQCVRYYPEEGGWFRVPFSAIHPDKIIIY